MLATAASIALFLLLAYAAWFDARWRRFPNLLAIACAVAAISAVWAGDGLRAAGMHIVAAGVFCGVLVLFEVEWRRARHTTGLGLGDIKALFSLVVFRPLVGVVSLGVALVLLAASCLVSNRRSLPLLPFLVPVFAIMTVTGILLT